MKNSQRYIYYLTAAALVALVIISLYVGGRNQPAAGAPDRAANGLRGPSYEEIVGDQQKRWGHGHTLSDSKSTNENSGASSSR